MTNLPTLRTPSQVAGDLIDGFTSRLPFQVDLNTGSVVSQLIESVKQSNFKSYAAVISMIAAQSVDRATGEALQRLARDANVPIFPATPSTGNVSITDTSFTKISTTVYAGQPAPVAGSLIVYVGDASSFPATGTIYIGRGTTNVEGPLKYDSVVSQSNGSYWLVNLDSSTPTTNFHNIGESVVVGQGGNRTLNVNTICQTAQGSSITAVQFATTSVAVIPDGEVTVSQVPVICQTPGPVGNVAAGAIVQVLGLPYSASANNPQPFTNGLPADTDPDIQTRIKQYASAKSRGTPVAIELAAQNVTAPDELKTVTSASTVSYADNSADLIFSDGGVYEPLFSGVGIEQVVAQAIGGEENLQLRNKPVAQVRVQSNNVAPFNIPAGYQLSVTIENVTTIHSFAASDFQVTGAGTALEVATSINSDPNINFLADTSNGETNVVVYPRDPNASDMLINALSSNDASPILGLPNLQEYTLRLYKNGVPLYQTGLFATVSTRPQQTWSSSITNGDTLVYSVDGTPAITATFTLAAFQAVSLSSSVSSTTSLDIWVSVMNNVMSGISAQINNESIELTSNRGTNSSASVEIIGGTLLSKMFDTSGLLLSEGRSSDYTLNLQTAQIGLVAPLQVDDNVSAGSSFTRANVVTVALPSGPSVQGRFWIVTDGAAIPIPNELSSTSQIQFSTVSGSRTITVGGRDGNTFVPQGFSQVLPGDWMLVWADSTDNSNLIANQFMLRVETVQEGLITVSGNFASATVSTPWFSASIDNIVFVRTAAPLQPFAYGPSDLVTFADEVQAGLEGVIADIVGSTIRISTSTSDSTGQLIVLAADAGGKTLGFDLGVVNNNIPSHRGFIVTDDSEAGYPNFNLSALTGTYINAETVTDANYLNLGGDTEDFMQVLSDYNVSNLSTVPDNNEERRVFVENYNLVPNQMNLLTPPFMQDGTGTPLDSTYPYFATTNPTLQPGTRYFLRSGFQFDSADSLSVIIDGNQATNSYSVEVARRLAVSAASTPTVQTFSATDLESSLPLNSPNSFETFNFANFKAWRQANAELTNGTYDMLFKFGDFGPSGNRVRVGFIYPSSPTQTTLATSINLSDVIDFGIVLPVTNAIPADWDATSSFTTSVVTTGGSDKVTYTWQVGTQPNFTSQGVTAGDVAIINYQSQFLPANAGYSAAVTAVTSTSFTLQLPTGKVVADQLSFIGASTTAGIITLTSASPHNIQAGQQFGLYDTALLSGSNHPYNSGSYLAISVTPTTVTAMVPSGVPSGKITSGTHISNVVTITAANHGLSVGNIVQISGAGSSYDGTFGVSAVLNVNQFQYINSGSSSPIATGQYDFQTIGQSSDTVAITSLSRSGSNIVTADTAVAHGFSPGQLVSIQNVTLTAWMSGNTYNVGDTVLDTTNNMNYQCIVGLTSTTPPSSDPAHWQLSTSDMSGIFPIATVPTTTSFTYLYSASAGSESSTSATATLYTAEANLARSIGGPSSYLSFVTVGTTVQQVIDFLNLNAAGQVSAIVNSGSNTAPITASTADDGASSNYLTGTVSSIITVESSRTFTIVSNTQFPAGSTVNVSSTYANGQFVVLSAAQVSGNWYLQVVGSMIQTSNATLSSPGTITGSVPYVMMQDGDNSIMSSDISSTPQFTLKNAWNTVPTVGEEVRLVAVTSDHLVRFWNELVVTGLSNVAEIDNSEFGTQVQIITNTFGSAGSVQVTGGSANSKTVALSGSGSALNDKLGAFTVPFALRQGLFSGSWINLQNTTVNDKISTFSETTFLQLTTNSLIITTSPPVSSEVFVTQRPSYVDNTTVFKVEQHGPFVAFVRVSGTSPNLLTAGVSEGDWVRVRNVYPQLYSSGTAYATGNKVKDGSGNLYLAVLGSTGQPLTNPTYWLQYNAWAANVSYTTGYVLYDGRLWLAVSPSTGITPGTNPAYWLPQEFDASNNGIYRVVRVFGPDVFWVDIPNVVEEVTQLLDPNDLTFYTYDSIMPGDTLVISGTILGPLNVGSYVVQDDAPDGSTLFPAPKQVYITTVPQPQGSTLLGFYYGQVVFQEAAPIQMTKRVFAVGPASGAFANVLVDSPDLIDRLSSSDGAYLTAAGKLSYSTNVAFGLDAYKSYQGLIEQLNLVIYGDPTDQVTYPGYRAAGTAVGIKPATVHPITISLSIRTQIGVAFSDIINQVQATVAGYVNQLDVGESVALSEIVAAAGSVNGVTSVVITSPTYDAGNDLIAVGANEQALVLTPSTDIVVSIIGS